MQETIIKARIIDRERMRELNRRRNGPGAVRLALQTTIYLASFAAVLWVPSGWPLVLAVGVSAVIQFAFFGLLHEACHRTIFRSHRANDAAGWIAALGQPMTPALMRAFHYTHHRHTHVLERDPELAGMKMMVGWPRGLMWLVTVSGLPIVFARFGWTIFAALVPPSVGAKAWDKVLPFTLPKERRRIAWEARVLFVVHAALLTAAFVWLPRLIWIYVALAIGHALLSVYITCEHRGLPEGADVPILAKTRSLKVPGLVRWLLWNMPYHAEHHAWPSVPFFNLPELHREVRAHLVHRDRPVHLHLSGGRGRALGAG